MKSPHTRSRRSAVVSTAGIVTLAIGLVTFVACNDSGNNDVANPQSGATAPSPESPTELTTERQTFTAQLNPVNGSGASGTARFVIDGSQLGVIIEASGLDPGMMHLQHIHSGTRCADASADANGDGFVDLAEAQPISGPPVISLALGANFGAPSVQASSPVQPGSPGAEPGSASPTPSAGAAAQAQYPVPDSDGSVVYVNSAAIASLNASGLSTPLASASPSASASPAASASPVASGTPANSAAAAFGNLLEGKVVEIHGLSASSSLPTSLRSLFGMAPNEELPVACGVITRTSP